MPLILAPSFDDHTRAEVEAHLEIVRARRIAAALEYQQSRIQKLTGEQDTLSQKLERNYDQLGKCLERLDRELLKAEDYLNKCTMLKSELGLVHDRIKLTEK